MYLFEFRLVMCFNEFRCFSIYHRWFFWIVVRFLFDSWSIMIINCVCLVRSLFRFLLFLYIPIPTWCLFAWHFLGLCLICLNLETMSPGLKGFWILFMLLSKSLKIMNFECCSWIMMLLVLDSYRFRSEYIIVGR